MPTIFISYRRSDVPDATGRIYDRLVDAFGTEYIFKDVDTIPLGSDFPEVIHQHIVESHVVIVIIGPNWVAARKVDGSPRLHDPDDFVRIEIEQALTERKVVIPVLVAEAVMPRDQHLPTSLHALLRKNAIAIRPDPDFHRDMNRLIRAIKQQIGEASYGTARKKREDNQQPPSAESRLQLNSTPFPYQPPKLRLNTPNVWTAICIQSIICLIPLSMLTELANSMGICCYPLFMALTQIMLIRIIGTQDILKQISVVQEVLSILIVSLYYIILLIGIIYGIGYLGSQLFHDIPANHKILYLFELLALGILGLIAIWISIKHFQSTKWTQIQFYKMITYTLFMGCMFQLLISVMARISGMTSIEPFSCAIFVLNFTCGPATVWWMMRKATRGYDLSQKWRSF